MTIVENAAGEWEVRNGVVVVATFATNAEAWRFLDRYHGQPITSTESWIRV
jgi:hypothetical protein